MHSSRWLSVLAMLGTMVSGACSRGSERPAQTRNKSVAEAPAKAIPPLDSLDLVGDSTDGNGFLINPHWGFQDAAYRAGQDVGNVLPDVERLCGKFQHHDPADAAHFFNGCTSQRNQIELVYSPAWASDPGQFVCQPPPLGHVNWRVSGRGRDESATTLTGRVYMSDISWIDGDLDLFLQTPRSPGRTRNDPKVTTTSVLAYGSRMIELEFDLDEVYGKYAPAADQWQDPWLHEFATVLAPGEDHNVRAARNRINGRNVVAIGLMGFDGVHAHTELHPVAALAIQLDPVNARTDRWVMFARREGNEGYCSRGKQKLALPGNVLSLEIPWRPGAGTARVTFTGSTSIPTRSYTFPLRIAVPLRAGRDGLVDGHFDVEWDVASTALQRGPKDVQWTQGDDPEEKATEAARRRHLPRQETGAPRGAGGLKGIAPTSAPPPQHEAADSVNRAALCRAYAGTLPGICSPAPARPR
jgi:hypothetical protein